MILTTHELVENVWFRGILVTAVTALAKHPSCTMWRCMAAVAANLACCKSLASEAFGEIRSNMQVFRQKNINLSNYPTSASQNWRAAFPPLERAAWARASRRNIERPAESPMCHCVTFQTGPCRRGDYRIQLKWVHIFCISKELLWNRLNIINNSLHFNTLASLKRNPFSSLTEHCWSSSSIGQKDWFFSIPLKVGAPQTLCWQKAVPSGPNLQRESGSQSPRKPKHTVALLD